MQKIVLHVYNCHNNLFESVTLEEVRNGVTAYLRYHCQHSGDLIRRMDRGIYKINTRSSSWRQLRKQLDAQAGMTAGDQSKDAQSEEPTLFNLF